MHENFSWKMKNMHLICKYCLIPDKEKMAFLYEFLSATFSALITGPHQVDRRINLSKGFSKLSDYPQTIHKLKSVLTLETHPLQYLNFLLLYNVKHYL